MKTLIISLITLSSAVVSANTLPPTPENTLPPTWGCTLPPTFDITDNDSTTITSIEIL